MTFAEYAKNHTLHPHCASCAGCLLDPKLGPFQVGPLPYWCVGCARELKAKLPKGAPTPWLVEFVPLGQADD